MEQGTGVLVALCSVVLGMGLLGDAWLVFRLYASLEETQRKQTRRQQRILTWQTVVGLLVLGIAANRIGIKTAQVLAMLALPVYILYRALLAPRYLHPALMNWQVRRKLRTFPPHLRDQPLGPEERLLVRELLRSRPKSFFPTMEVVLRFKHHPADIREAFPSLNRAYLYGLPAYLGLFCANCMRYTELKKFRCAHCQSNELYLGVERFVLSYDTSQARHYWADRAAGVVYLNLAHDQAWTCTHLPISEVALNLRNIPQPDYFLNRVLTGFPQTHAGSGTVFHLQGLSALAENTRRMLADRGITSQQQE